MKRGIVVFLACAVVALSGTPSRAQSRGPRGRDQDAARYGWLSSLEEGKVRARQSGKPIMVVFRCVP